jgi:quercetin dioxygenase-like cupin family protein
MSPRLPLIAAALLAVTAPPALAQEASEGISVTRLGDRPSGVGPTSRFTGTVRVDPAFEPAGAVRVSGAYVTFEPGARTNWHAHPQGQTLVVTAGRGWVGGWDAEPVEIRSGDVVRIPPGVKHWHGASERAAMTHLAIQENPEGGQVDWMEPVNAGHYPPDPSQ